MVGEGFTSIGVRRKKQGRWGGVLDIRAVLEDYKRGKLVDA